jgi:hypothetical protein
MASPERASRREPETPPTSKQEVELMSTQTDFIAPIENATGLTDDELTALVARGRTLRSKAAHAYTRSLFAVLGRIFRRDGAGHSPLRPHSA